VIDRFIDIGGIDETKILHDRPWHITLEIQFLAWNVGIKPVYVLNLN
jgi:hypothetical protein